MVLLESRCGSIWQIRAESRSGRHSQSYGDKELVAGSRILRSGCITRLADALHEKKKRALDNQRNATPRRESRELFLQTRELLCCKQHGYVCACVCIHVRTAWSRAIVEIGSPLVRDLQFRRLDRHISAVRQLGTWPDAGKGSKGWIGDRPAPH